MALMPGAEWRGPLPLSNCSPGQMIGPVGVTVHHADGSLAAAEGRFKTPNSQASAHFGVDFDGHIVQWVDTADVAYHACGANWHGWVGIENASDPGAPNAPMTDAQVAANRAIIAWLGTPAVPASSPTSGGVGYHRQFPGGCTNDDWGSTSCPGDGIVAQIPAICSATPPSTGKDATMIVVQDGGSIYCMTDKALIPIPDVPTAQALAAACNANGAIAGVSHQFIVNAEASFPTSTGGGGGGSVSVETIAAGVTAGIKNL